MKFFRRKKGFTFNELLVVVLILGILAAIGTPIYTKAVKKSRASDAIHIMSIVSEQQEKYYIDNNDFAKNFKTLNLTVKGFEGVQGNAKSLGRFNYTLSNDNNQACIKAQYITAGTEQGYTLFRNYDTQNQGCMGEGCKDLISIIGEGDADCGYEPPSDGKCETCPEGQHLVGVYPYCQCVPDDGDDDWTPQPCTTSVLCSVIDAKWQSGQANCSGLIKVEGGACELEGYSSCDISKCEEAPKNTCTLECPGSLTLDSETCVCKCSSGDSPAWYTNGDTETIEPVVNLCSKTTRPACDGTEANVGSYGTYFNCSQFKAGETNSLQSFVCACGPVEAPKEFYGFKCSTQQAEITLPGIGVPGSGENGTMCPNSPNITQLLMSYASSFSDMALDDACRSLISPGLPQYTTTSSCSSKNLGKRYIRITPSGWSATCSISLPSSGYSGLLTSLNDVAKDLPGTEPSYNDACTGLGTNTYYLRGPVYVYECVKDTYPVFPSYSSCPVGGGGGGGNDTSCNESSYEKTDLLTEETKCITMYNGGGCGALDGTSSSKDGPC